MGGERAAGFGAFDDSVYQVRDFDFGGAPAKFDVGGDAVLFQVAFGDGDKLSRDALAFQVFGTGNGELLGTASTQRYGREVALE